jgi:chromosomal replication initiator protein
MYLIRKHLNLPYKKIGQYFDRDHSTVMASVTVIEQKLKLADEQILNALKRIEWSLKD